MGTIEDERLLRQATWCGPHCKRQPNHHSFGEITLFGRIIPASMHISGAQWTGIRNAIGLIPCVDGDGNCIGRTERDHIREVYGMTPSAVFTFAPMPRQGSRAVFMPNSPVPGVQRPYYFHTIEEGIEELSATEAVCHEHHMLRRRVRQDVKGWPAWFEALDQGE